jgi:hypothetical protein
VAFIPGSNLRSSFNVVDQSSSSGGVFGSISVEQGQVRGPLQAAVGYQGTLKGSWVEILCILVCHAVERF